MNEVIADGSAISNSNLRMVAKLLRKQQSNAKKDKINEYFTPPKKFVNWCISREIKYAEQQFAEWFKNTLSNPYGPKCVEGFKPLLIYQHFKRFLKENRDEFTPKNFIFCGSRNDVD